MCARRFGRTGRAHTIDGGEIGGMAGGTNPPPMSTIKAFLTKPSTYVLIIIGVVLAFAYSRFVPSVIKDTAAKLPGAQ